MMTDDIAPNKPPTESAPIASGNQLSAANSQVGDVVQVSGSAGAVVNQIHITQLQAPHSLSRTDLVFWTLMVLAVLVASRATINLGLPPIVSQVVAGGFLAGIIWKFFERVEAVLTDATKKEIARWLRVKNFETGIIAEEAEAWPETFARVFDQVFGKTHLSWRCFGRSTIASIAIGLLGFPLAMDLSLNRQLISDIVTHHGGLLNEVGGVLLLGSVVPDYVSLLETRFVLRLMRGCSGFARLLLMTLDLVFTLATAIGVSTFIAALFFARVFSSDPFSVWGAGFNYLFVGQHSLGRALIPPAMLTSIWLWLYAGSGFLLKATNGFDIGFDWFNRKLDIEKKPLSAIGLVAGVLAALAYWATVIVSRFLRT
jgi:hypothetical protein